jgi:hypothetical protein
MNFAPLSIGINSNKHFWHKFQLINNTLYKLIYTLVTFKLLIKASDDGGGGKRGDDGGYY